MPQATVTLDLSKIADQLVEDEERREVRKIADEAMTAARTVTLGIRLSKRLARHIRDTAEASLSAVGAGTFARALCLRLCRLYVVHLIACASVVPVKVAGRIQHVFCLSAAARRAALARSSDRVNLNHSKERAWTPEPDSCLRTTRTSLSERRGRRGAATAR